jgi:signal transduction histidine kinase
MTSADPAVLSGDVWDDPTGPARKRRLAFDVGTAVLFTLAVGGIQLALSPASAIAALLLGVALAVRRRSVPIMVVAAVAGSVTQLLTSQLALVADLAYFPLFLTLGAHRDRAVRRFGLAGVLVAVVVAGVWGTSHGLVGSPSGTYAALTTAALTAIITGGGWITGLLRWQRRQGVQARVDATVAAVERRRLEQLYEEEQQRARIAADMHDVVAHSWAVVAAQADGARYQIRADPAQAEAALEVIGQTARSAMLDVRALLTRLRERSDLEVALLLERSDDVLERMRASGMEVELSRYGEPAPPSDEVGVVTARLALAEALTNALKHGDLARPVVVEEDWTDGYRLKVVNTVVAGRPTAAPDRAGVGHGLRGMTERVTELGGRVTARAEGARWVTEVSIPGSVS